MPVADVQRRLAAGGLKPHANRELCFMSDDFSRDNRYQRSEVDPLAAYGVIRGPADNREPSADEPNLPN